MMTTWYKLNGAIVDVITQRQPPPSEQWLRTEKTVFGDWTDNGDDTFSPPPSPPTPFKTLPRPAFLFMMGKLGVTVADVEALIAAMPSGTQEEQDAKALAALVFANTTTFKRDNDLLNTLVAASPLTDAQVDAAWRVAEGLTW